MKKLKRFVIHNGIKPIGNVEMKAICGRTDSHFCSTDDRNKKLVVDTVLVREAHTVVGVQLLVPVHATVPMEITHDSLL